MRPESCTLGDGDAQASPVATRLADDLSRTDLMVEVWLNALGRITLAGGSDQSAASKSVSYLV